MNYVTLLQSATLRPLAGVQLALPGLPPDGTMLLRDLLVILSTWHAAWLGPTHIGSSVHISSHRHDSASWYEHRFVKALVVDGDLTIDGDLIDDNWRIFPILIVTGTLSLRSWLRGGMASFIGGHVRASGVIVGQYNDSALFVAGDLHAAGYIPCVRPYPDIPQIAPHQFGGRVAARVFDAADRRADARSAFVPDVLAQDQEEVWFDPPKLLERAAAGLPIWKDPGASRRPAP